MYIIVLLLILNTKLMWNLYIHVLAGGLMAVAKKTEVVSFAVVSAKRTLI